MSRKRVVDTQADYTMRELINDYRVLKLDLERRKKEYEESVKEDNLALAFLEGDLLNELDARGISSVKIAREPGIPDYLAGTLYTSELTTAKVEDPELFFDYVFATRNTDLLFARATDKEVKRLMEETHEPPPGVTVQHKKRLGFRKAQ